MANGTSTSNASKFSPALFMLAVVFLFILASLLQLTPPPVLPADAPADEFSAERAYAHMQAMDVGPHWTGSEGNAKVRDYIAEQLRGMGLEVEIQSVQSFFDNGAVAIVDNVIGRIRGTDNSKAVLFNVHYDGVASSPGGSYNAYLATFLETVRALQAGTAPKNDLIFIFNDGEEWGFMGAKGFINEHPWAKDVGLVVEGIPRGIGGPVFLATTSDQNGWLAGQIISAVPYPITYSLTRDAYAQLPGGGDLEAYEAAGMKGLMITWQKGHVTYHAMTDNNQNVELRSVQHLGSYMLSLARHFGDVDITTIPQEPNRVFFNLFRWTVIQYPGALVIPFAALAIGLFIVVLAMGFRRKRLTAKGIGVGALAVLLSIVGGHLISTLLWMAVNALIHPPVVSMVADVPYNPDLYALSFVAFTIALSVWLFIRFREKSGAESLAAGGLIWWALFAALTAFALPGGSYLFTWTLVFGALGLGFRVSSGDQLSAWKEAGVLSALALPILLIVVPVIYLFYIGILFTIGLPGVVPFFVALTVWILIPQLDVMTRPHRAWTWAGAASMGILFLLAAIFTTKTDAAHPRPYYLIYGLDADKGEAFWFSDNPDVDEWMNQFFTEGAVKDDFSGFFAFDWLQEGKNFVKSPAPMASLAAPNVEMMSDTTSNDVRTLTLRITSPRGAKMVNAFFEPAIPVISATLDGKSFYSGDAATPTRLPIHNWTVPTEGFELTLQIPANVDVTLVVADQSAGFPQFDNFTMTPRPDYLMVPPQAWFLFGDSTWVKKTFIFE